MLGHLASGRNGITALGKLDSAAKDVYQQKGQVPRLLHMMLYIGWAASRFRMSAVDVVIQGATQC